VLFLTLYSGDTPASARIVAISAHGDIVRRFAEEMLDLPPEVEGDPVMEAVEAGRRQALKVVADN
jgi:hypothetical protein